MSDNKSQRDVKNQTYLKDDPSKVSLDSDDAVQDLISQTESNDQSGVQNEHNFRYSIDDMERKDKRNGWDERECKDKPIDINDKEEQKKDGRRSMVYENKCFSGELEFPATNGKGEFGVEDGSCNEADQMVDKEMDPRLSEPIQPSGFRAMRPTRLVVIPNSRRESIVPPPLPRYMKPTEAFLRRTEGEKPTSNAPPIPDSHIREVDPANLPRYMKPTEAFLRRTEGDESTRTAPPIPCSLIREVDPTNLPRYMYLTEAAKRHYNGLLEPVVKTISAPLHLPRESASNLDRYPSTMFRRMESEVQVEVSSEDQLLLNEIARILKESIQWGVNSRKSTYPSDCIQIKKFVGIPPDAEQIEKEKEKEREQEKKVELPSRSYMRPTQASRKMEEEKKKINTSGGERPVTMQSCSTRAKPSHASNTHNPTQLDDRSKQNGNQHQNRPHPSQTAASLHASKSNEYNTKKIEGQRDESHLPSYMRSTVASRRREEEIRKEKQAKSQSVGKRS